MNLVLRIANALQLKDNEEVRALTLTWESPNQPVVSAEVVIRSRDGTGDRTEQRSDRVLRNEDEASVSR